MVSEFEGCNRKLFVEDKTTSAKGAETGSQVQARSAPRLEIESIDYSRAENARGQSIIRNDTANLCSSFRAWLPTMPGPGAARFALAPGSFLYLLPRLMNGFRLT